MCSRHHGITITDIELTASYAVHGRRGDAEYYRGSIVDRPWRPADSCCPNLKVGATTSVDPSDRIDGRRELAATDTRESKSIR